MSWNYDQALAHVVRETGLLRGRARRVLNAHRAFHAAAFGAGDLPPQQVAHLRRKYREHMPRLHDGVPIYDAAQHVLFVARLARVDAEIAARVTLAEARYAFTIGDCDAASVGELEAIVRELERARAN